MDKNTLNRATILKEQINQLEFNIDMLEKSLLLMAEEKGRIEIVIRAVTKPWPFFMMRNRIPGGRKSQDFQLTKEVLGLVLTEKQKQLRNLEIKLERL